MSYEYSENILVQESAGDLLKNELGWRVVFAHNQEILGESGTFGRNAYREVLLQRYFREALQKLNPWITPTQKQTLDDSLKKIDFSSVQHEKERIFQDVLQKSYRDVIRVFNEKNLINGIDEIFGLKKGEYRPLVLRLLNGKKRKEIVDVLVPYMPESLSVAP